MGTMPRSWRQQIRQRLVTILLVASVLVVAIVLLFIGYRFDWTGFNGNNKSGKTLWDWLNLLGVLAIPVVVGLGTLWFTSQQGKVNNAVSRDSQNETALQAYIDKMSELLLEKKLRESAEDDEVRKIARVRTLTVLSRLDVRRKKSVLQFLYESGLIDKNKCIVNLHDANLRGVFLYRANLNEANLGGVFLGEAILTGAEMYRANLGGAKLPGAEMRGAKLGEANLCKAELRGADLSYANLSRAYLGGVDFEGADLSGANLEAAKVLLIQLDQAKSLQGATMPDGSKHP